MGALTPLAIGLLGGAAAAGTGVAVSALARRRAQAANNSAISRLDSTAAGLTAATNTQQATALTPSPTTAPSSTNRRRRAMLGWGVTTSPLGAETPTNVGYTRLLS